MNIITSFIKYIVSIFTVLCEKFAQVQKAKKSCRNAKNDISKHFANVSKMVEIGSKTKRNIDNIMPSRYACYLIVHNGNCKKEKRMCAKAHIIYPV